MKIQFASGGNHLDGWLNLDQGNGDISKPLAFKNDSVDFILCEHGTEHITPQQGYKFLQECYRILKPSGVTRIIVPDICKVWVKINDQYRSLIREGLKDWYPAIGRPSPILVTDKDAIEALVFCHGHQAIYNEDLLSTLMEAIGFDVQPCEYGKSKHPELNSVDQHFRYMGLENCILESCVVEGTK